MTTTYSAFFSSGLLAPHHAFMGYSSAHMSAGKDSFYSYYDQPSPARASSPMPLPDDSDIEVDDIDLDGRGTTPTPEARSSKPVSTNTTMNPAADTAAATTQQRPRLRKRRSSLTVAVSPMSAIRSPARTATAASQIQRHLATTPLRARSGSVGCGTGGDLFGNIGLGNAATEGTSLVGRMRSGSMGGVMRPRRGVRRINSVPAPAPPPTAPLPALPCFQLPVTNLNHPGLLPPPHSAPLFGTMHANTNIAQRTGDAGIKKGRERAFSITNADTIDEEMKEN